MNFYEIIELNGRSRVSLLTISHKEFAKLAEYIKVNYGIYLKQEKQTLLVGRLQNVLQQAGFTNFTDYYNYIVANKDKEAVNTLINKITTNHTYFMREPQHFYFFRDQVLPFWANILSTKDLRVWSAACSSGEEAYTLAMIIDEYFGQDKAAWDTKILATDISSQVLDMAKDAIYSNERIAPLPKHWKVNYFKRYDSENSVLIDRIKQEVIYRKFNLMDEVFPFRKRFHAIFCRNVMIYFDNTTKEKLVDKLYEQIEYGGYLFIGHSEALNRETTRFKYISPSVYRKE